MSATAERMPNPVAVFRQEIGGMEPQFAAALPKHIPVERFVRVFMTAVGQNPDLLKCTRRSLWNAAMRAAQDGLLPDSRDGAIVAYKDQAQWMPMIAGLRKKVRNSGEIATWECYVVYELDEFDFQLGDNPHIAHKPALGNRGKPIAAYSIAVLKSGERSREVMSVTEIEAVRARSRAAKNGPWVTDWAEMARKTVARRHSKVLPMSSDLDDLMRRDEDLYDFDGAKEEAKAAESASPRTLAGRLDRLAIAAQEDHAMHDPETGEIKEKEAAQNNASDADKSNSAKEKDVAPNQQGSEHSAEGAHPLDVPSELRRESNEPPKTPQGYVEMAKAYIADADDADWLETRWREEKQLRQWLGVPVSDAKVLGDAVLAKAKELRAMIAGDAAHPVPDSTQDK